MAPTCLVFPPLPCSFIDYSIFQYRILSSISFKNYCFPPRLFPFVFLFLYQLLTAVIPQLYWSITTLPNLKWSSATVTHCQIIDRVGERCQRDHSKIFHSWSFTENTWPFCFIFRSTTSLRHAKTPDYERLLRCYDQVLVPWENLDKQVAVQVIILSRN